MPNITFMWINNTKSDIACRMTPENVCVKYSYYYNQARKSKNNFFLINFRLFSKEIAFSCTQSTQFHNFKICLCFSGKYNLYVH